MKGSIIQMEAAIDFIQQYQDLVREHQDWQKLMWDTLSVYTDYTGRDLYKKYLFLVSYKLF